MNDVVELGRIAIVCAIMAMDRDARVSELTKDEERAMAIAVIEAMRDLKIVVRFPDGGIAHELRGDPGEIWRTLIDAALADASPDIGKEGIVNDVR